MISDERKFIHDLSNPISIALGNLRLIARRWDEDPEVHPTTEMLARMEKVMENFEKIIELVAERRRALHQNASNI